MSRSEACGARGIWGTASALGPSRRSLAFLLFEACLPCWLDPSTGNVGRQGEHPLFTRMPRQTMLFSFQSPLLPSTLTPRKQFLYLASWHIRHTENYVVRESICFLSSVAFFVPFPPLFECIFSVVTVLCFVPMHAYLSCQCKHQWQSLYSFLYFSFSILLVFRTPVSEAWAFMTIFLSFHLTFFYVDFALFSISIFWAFLFTFSLLVFCLDTSVLKCF